MKSHIYTIIPFLMILCIANASAYTYQIPTCNSTLNFSCITITNTSTITSSSQAFMYYQNGNLYITNDTFPQNYTIINTTVINNGTVNYYNITNLTQIIINNSNGSSYVVQQNISVDNSYLSNLFNQLYSGTNFSKYYNKTEIDNLCATQGQLTNCATKTELVNFDNRLASLNNINSMNWSSFNLTRINEYMDEGGSFSIIWKVVVIVEGIVIVLLLLFVVRSMMSGGY